MSISIKPLEDRIVVQTAEAEQTTASGLVIPNTAKEKPQEGKVVAVGPGRIDDSGNRVPVDVVSRRDPTLGRQETSVKEAVAWTREHRR